MIKIGVADYGLNCWYGALYDYTERFEMLRKAGYDGIERLEAKSACEAVEYSSEAKRCGMDFATCRGGTAMETIRWSAALGKKYIWADSGSKDFSEFTRQINSQTSAAAKYGVKVGLHNHLGLTVEKQDELEAFLAECPECGIILDVGHLAAAGGKPVETIEKYHDRLVAVHLKDYVIKDENAQYWWDRLRFCELGAGVMGDMNRDILKALLKVNYSGWIFVEHDTHLRDPLEDLKISREYIAGFGI